MSKHRGGNRSHGQVIILCQTITCERRGQGNHRQGDEKIMLHGYLKRRIVSLF